MEFRTATRGDIPQIIRMRIQFLREISGAQEEEAIEKLSSHLENYLREHLARDFINLFAMEGSNIIATGAICFHHYPPSFDNVNATRAYIMNVYTVKAYRQKGIAAKIFEKLLMEARRRKIDSVSLHATESGRPLYEKYGFEPVQNEMTLSLINFKPVTHNP